MEFLDPAKKLAQTRRLWIGYFLVGIAILLASYTLIVLAFGYDVDRKTGEVIQNGLIFTASAPESSTIYLNGKENGQTDKRLTVPAGHYDIELRRAGYQTWKKSIDLAGSSIERLIYPVLFPEKLKPVESQTYAGTPSISTQSPDRRWIIIGQPGSVTNFETFDTTNPADKPINFSLPAKLLTAPAKDAQNNLSLVEWSTDNRHVLLKHTFGTAFEFIMVDRETPESSVNINTLLARTPTSISLKDKKYDQLYLYDGTTKDLDSVDIKTKVVSPVLRAVDSFKSYQANTILYATPDSTNPAKTIVKIMDNGQTYTLKQLDATPVLMDLARFDGSLYVAVTSVNEGKVYVYKDIIDKLRSKPITDVPAVVLLRVTNPTKLSFSANARFVSIQGGSKFSVYDFEEQRHFSFSAKENLNPDEQASWMDGHRLIFSNAGHIYVYEFDGANRRELVPIVANSLPYFDRDYRRLYTVAPSVADPAKTALTRTDLKLNLKL